MEGLERAIKIIKHEIMKRESQRDSPEYLLNRKLLTEEIKSLDKALELVKNNSVLGDVSNCNSCGQELTVFAEQGTKKYCRECA